MLKTKQKQLKNQEVKNWIRTIDTNWETDSEEIFVINSIPFHLSKHNSYKTYNLRH